MELTFQQYCELIEHLINAQNRKEASRTTVTIDAEINLEIDKRMKAIGRRVKRTVRL